jgi:branched-subunit amino acid aminotransferase/4-amino-4-deoxychorismate lyase
MALKFITRAEIYGNGKGLMQPWHDKYLSMFSSVYGGITKDPVLMTVPADDHMVHRGDGVFDVSKCIEGGIYQFDGHLERLFRSAQSIFLTPPYTLMEVKDIIMETVRAGGERNCLIRITISRGPGGFSVDPFECSNSQLYVNVFKLKQIPDGYINNGVSIVTTGVPIKPSFFATVKSCNYLPNVLMAMEARKRSANYSLSMDEQGFLAEGATENIALLTPEGELLFPVFDRILAGLTVTRIIDLAHSLISTGEIENLRFVKLGLEDAYRCKEFFLFSTSIDVLPVVKIDDHAIGDGAPGPIAKRLRQLIRDDMIANQELITHVFH